MKHKTLKIRKLLTVSALSLSTLLVACDRNISIEETTSVVESGESVANDSAKTSDADSGSESDSTSDTASDTASDSKTSVSIEDSEPLTPPESNEALYDLLIGQFKAGNLKKMYPFAAETLQYMLTEDSFQSLYGDPLLPFGEVKEVQQINHEATESYDHYEGKLIYDHAECTFDFMLRDQKIESIYLNPFFTDSFDQTLDSGVTKHYFPLESSGYKLNAVYTKAAKENAPTVLIISKQGATDYNGLIGTRPILKDLADELAERGISSLRMEKRFYRYYADMKETDGLEKEYFEDYTNALEWLKKQDDTQKIWLLGHDLGGNIAAALTERTKVDGLVFMNGSARHLADILVDTLGQLSTQLTGSDEDADKDSNREFVETLKSITHENAHGATYNATSDYYWADLNDLDTLSSLKKSGVPTLIVNSKDDEQLFEGDYELWEKEFGNDNNVTVTFLNGIDHFGYEKTSESLPYYKVCNYSDELSDTIADYIKAN